MMDAREEREAMAPCDPAWGWDLFHCSGSDYGEWQVQRYDEPFDGSDPVFETDDDAWVRAGTLALDPTDMTDEAKYAREVLAFLYRHNMREYELIVKMAKVAA